MYTNNMTDFKTVIFYGPSGSGKGTQAALLKEYLEKYDKEHNVIYIETGTELRKFAKGKSFSSEYTRKILGEGKLMPSFIPTWAWTSLLIDKYSGKEHLIFDGVARRKQEAVLLEGALKFYCIKKIYVVVLNVSHEWSFNNLKKRGRSDDTDEDINRRLAWYNENALDALDVFKNSDYFSIVDVDGEQTTTKVRNQVLKGIGLKVPEDESRTKS